MNGPARRVFISYSHDSDAHCARVRRLADSLRRYGIDARLDAYWHDTPPEGWPLWAQKGIDEADKVLLVCTETYCRRVHKEEQPDVGHGVCWEADIIYAELYESQTKSNKFVPIILSPDDRRFIPKTAPYRFAFYCTGGRHRFRAAAALAAGPAQSPCIQAGANPEPWPSRGASPFRTGRQ